MYSIAVAVVLCAVFADARTTAAASPHLAQTIPLPGVEGRIDHLAIDAAGSRLFACGLGNDSLEVIDLRKGERIHSITGLAAPQGAAYVAAPARLYVANERGGLCNIYDGQSLALLSSVEFKDDADNLRYDPAAKRIYVGYGDGGIGVIDAVTGKSGDAIKLSGHPEAFVLEKNGSRIFVNVPSKQHIAVVDRDEGKVIATWRVDGASANFPLALDEANHRLFVACRMPAKLIVLNTDSGAPVTSIQISGDPDDIFYDDKRQRIYVVCGAGSVDVITQTDRDTYTATDKIATASGARTGLFVPELSTLFVAVPHQGSQTAEIRRFAVD